MSNERIEKLVGLLAAGGTLTSCERCSLYGDFTYKDRYILLDGVMHHLTSEEYSYLKSITY